MVDDELSGGLRVEPEFRDGADAAFVEYRPVAPGLATVVGHQEKGVAGECGHEAAADPAILKVNELHLIEAGGFHPVVHFLPRQAGVIAGKEEGKKSDGISVQIAGHKDARAAGFNGVKISVHGAGLVGGAVEREAFQVGGGAGERDRHGVLRDDGQAGNGEQGDRRLHGNLIVAGQSGVRYPYAVQTVERQGSFFRFWARPFEHGKTPGPAADLLVERTLVFGSHASAAAFLRNFAGDSFAVRGLQSVVTQLSPVSGMQELAEQWIERLALLMVTGRVEVVEQIPRGTSAETTTRQAASPTPYVPRRAEVPEPVEVVEAPTFSASHADEEAQVKALVEAARHGTPFCEECAKAALADG